MRKCTKCGLEAVTEDDLYNFVKDKTGKHGRRNLCKPCGVARCVEYDRDNPTRDAYKVAHWNSRKDVYLVTRVAWRREFRAEQRRKAVEIYGGKCVTCGSTENLEFDHVNGDGNEHRAIEKNQDMLRRIAKQGRQLDDWELQLLCQTCHLAKTREERRQPFCKWGHPKTPEFQYPSGACRPCNRRSQRAYYERKKATRWPTDHHGQPSSRPRFTRNTCSTRTPQRSSTPSSTRWT